MTDREFEAIERTALIDYFRVAQDHHCAGRVLAMRLVSDVTGECPLTYAEQGSFRDFMDRCLAEAVACKRVLGRLPSREEMPGADELYRRRLELREAWLAARRGAVASRPSWFRRLRLRLAAWLAGGDA